MVKLTGTEGVSLIDTGGYVIGGGDTFEAAIDQQVEVAIDEADAILFVVDVEVGVSVMDEEAARLLHRSDKPVLLVINKVDNALRSRYSRFFCSRIDKTFHVSAINGSEQQLLDTIINVLPKTKEPEIQIASLTVVGRSMQENHLLSMRNGKRTQHCYRSSRHDKT